MIRFPDEIDIRLYGQLLIAEHAGWAPEVVSRRVSELTMQGDAKGAAVWGDILAAIGSLRAMQPPEGAASINHEAIPSLPCVAGVVRGVLFCSRPIAKRGAQSEANVEPLYDYAGSVVGWLGDSSRIIDLLGRSAFWIADHSSIYDYQGGHRGWLIDGHWRGHDGGVVVWTVEAKNLGVMPPLPRLPPLPPLPSLEPMKPIPSRPPLRPLNALAWSREQWPS